jgi:hypothetical protein
VSVGRPPGTDGVAMADGRVIALLPNLVADDP